jgi:glyoxylase-like metal-dependent hydrolase (beta-lactamase superfamily II)
VVVTHLHYDHVGNFDLFPSATLHLQEREMNYATGRYMCQECFRGAFEVEDVVGMVREVYAGRVRFHDGDAELFPGVSLHLIGGHTMGLQVVRVATRRGWVVLASDASHFYANMEQARPFPIVGSVADMVDGYTKLRSLAESPAHIIPGHDPLVMQPTQDDVLPGGAGIVRQHLSQAFQSDRRGCDILIVVPSADCALEGRALHADGSRDRREHTLSCRGGNDGQ